MNDPSIESISDIPAANRIGRQRIAYHRAPAAPAPPAMTRSATSLAVSNPRPNSNPTGYMCRGLATALVRRPNRRFISLPGADRHDQAVLRELQQAARDHARERS